MEADSVQRIKVVILIGQTGLGGSERQLYYFLKYADRDKFDFSVVSLTSREPFTLNQSILDLGVNLFQFPPACRGIFARSRKLVDILRQIKPLIFHSWSFYTNPYAGLWGKLLKIPVVIGSLRNEPLAEEIRSFNPILKKLAYYSVHALIVNSKLAKDQLIKMGYPGNRLHYIHNSIESEPVGASDSPPVDLSEFGISPNDKIVMTVGNLQRRKNHPMFIRGMENIIRESPEVKCLVVGRELKGEPGIKEELLELITGLGLNKRVFLTGPRVDVRRLMKQIDIFCLTARSEGTPNVVLEAMEASVPVVATRVGDVPDIIKDGENGYSVDMDNIEDFRLNVKTLLSDIRLAKEIGAAGRKTVLEMYSPADSAGQMESTYLELYENSGCRGKGDK